MNDLQLFARLVVLRLRRDEGATAVEYALMVALIALAIVITVGTLGSALQAKFAYIAGRIAAAAAG